MPRLKKIVSTSLVVAALLVVLGRAAVAAPTLAVGVRATGAVEKAKDGQDLEEGIPKQFASGLESAGYEVELINDVSTAAQIRECSTDDCLKNTIGNGVASLAAQVSVEVRRSTKRGRDYAVFVVLARTSPDRQVWREKHACRSCSVDAAKHLAFLIGAQLAGEVSKTPQAPAPTAPVADPSVVAVASSPAPLPKISETSLRTTPPGTADHRVTVPRYVPWAVLGASALSVASGIYLLSIDDDPSCDLSGGKRRCPERFDTGTAGTALAVAGGTSAIAGIVSFYFREPATQQRTSVSLTASGVFIAGSF